MILLDTNYLVRLLVPESAEARRIEEWYQATDLCTSSIAWYEFLSGPIDADGAAIAQAILRDRILVFSSAMAMEAARLWNATGRQRRLRVDAMIAATAIVACAELATANSADFRPFEALGLRLL